MHNNFTFTRTYAPIIKKILDKYDAAAIHGMVRRIYRQNLAFRRKPHAYIYSVPPLFVDRNKNRERNVIF
jgi:hypothetical protein